MVAVDGVLPGIPVGQTRISAGCGGHDQVPTRQDQSPSRHNHPRAADDGMLRGVEQHTWARWPSTAAELEQVQDELGCSTPALWSPPRDRLRIASAFVAFVPGEQGPGHPGDRAWVGAVLVDRGRVVSSRVVPGVAGASYVPGLLALREGPMLADALGPLAAAADVIMVDATGRDHPRHAGLAVHLGAVLGRPSIGVTHRRLQAPVTEPGMEAGSTAPVYLDGVEVGRTVRMVAGVRPVVAHAGWRTDASVAARVVLSSRGGARTPEPLRQARRLARTYRDRQRLDGGSE